MYKMNDSEYNLYNFFLKIIAVMSGFTLILISGLSMYRIIFGGEDIDIASEIMPTIITVIMSMILIDYLNLRRIVLKDGKSDGNKK